MCARAVMVDVSLPISSAIHARARAARLTSSTDGALRDTLYVFRWNRLDRKGQTCRVLARGAMNSCLVEFEDGWRMITSRNAICRKATMPRATLQSLILEAIGQGYDITIRLRRRDDGGEGRVTMPNHWARQLGMTDAEMDHARAEATQEK